MMCIVMVVVMIELLGIFLALGEVTGKSIDQASLTRGLRADGIGTILGRIFNTFPYTSFSQNVGLCRCDRGLLALDHRHRGQTDARARAAAKDVGTGGGSSADRVGWRGPGDVRHGRRDWRAYSPVVNFKSKLNNLFIVPISVGFGMIPLVAPAFFHILPHEQSGILLSAVVSVILNVFFNGLGSGEAARSDAVGASAGHV